jgi:hypothetical protein
MKRIYTLIICLFILITLKAQNGFHRFSIYGNTGLSIRDNFEYKTSNTSYGEFGVKFYLLNGFSVGLNGNAVYFRKSININDFIASYYTQYNAGGLFIIYENEIIPKWYLGIAGSANFGVFSGLIYDNYGNHLKQTTGILDTYLNRTVFNYVGTLNLRRKLTNRVDIQIGASYNDFQSYYLDMYNTSNTVDNYIIGYGGLVFNFGKSNGEDLIINSKKISCPNVRY